MYKPVKDTITRYVSPAIIKAVERHHQIELNHSDINACWWAIANTNPLDLKRYKGVGPSGLRKCRDWLSDWVTIHG